MAAALLARRPLNFDGSYSPFGLVFVELVFLFEVEFLFVLELLLLVEALLGCAIGLLGNAGLFVDGAPFMPDESCDAEPLNDALVTELPAFTDALRESDA
jgi:hypothetical protein